MSISFRQLKSLASDTHTPTHRYLLRRQGAESTFPPPPQMLAIHDFWVAVMVAMAWWHNRFFPSASNPVGGRCRHQSSSPIRQEGSGRKEADIGYLLLPSPLLAFWKGLLPPWESISSIWSYHLLALVPWRMP